ncbi:hypothetical protein CVS40_8231 [Lucilia cuprina]|nr:hypothetical protein CVS40_8231 [Lucilia cuprina]
MTATIFALGLWHSAPFACSSHSGYNFTFIFHPHLPKEQIGSKLWVRWAKFSNRRNHRFMNGDERVNSHRHGRNSLYQPSNSSSTDSASSLYGRMCCGRVEEPAKKSYGLYGSNEVFDEYVRRQLNLDSNHKSIKMDKLSRPQPPNPLGLSKRVTIPKRWKQTKVPIRINKMNSMSPVVQLNSEDEMEKGNVEEDPKKIIIESELDNVNHEKRKEAEPQVQHILDERNLVAKFPFPDPFTGDIVRRRSRNSILRIQDHQINDTELTETFPTAPTHCPQTSPEGRASQTEKSAGQKAISHARKENPVLLHLLHIITTTSKLQSTLLTQHLPPNQGHRKNTLQPMGRARSCPGADVPLKVVVKRFSLDFKLAYTCSYYIRVIDPIMSSREVATNVSPNPQNLKSHMLTHSKPDNVQHRYGRLGIGENPDLATALRGDGNAKPSKRNGLLFMRCSRPTTRTQVQKMVIIRRNVSAIGRNQKWLDGRNDKRQNFIAVLYKQIHKSARGAKAEFRNIPNLG